MIKHLFKAYFSHTKKIFLFSAFFSCVFFVHGENFRVHKLIPITFSDIKETIPVESGINDALYITLPDDLTYISGVELNFKIPEEIITWRDSVAYMLYEDISPSPEEAELSYSGERIHVATIPGNFSLKLYIPLSSDFAIKDSPYSSKLPTPSNFGKKGAYLRFMMVMKGVPESLENSILDITAKPVLKNLGALELSVHPASSEEKKYSIYIDDIPVQDYDHKLLSVGEHHLSIVSDSYRNELRTFIIEQAKTTPLAVNLRGIEPLIKIISPKNAVIYLDDEQIHYTQETIATSQGEHIIKFILGDYEITKSISVQNGKSYTINLNVDASITEED
ncbi:MAG: hypothetical protein IJ727_07930, partial [Treponema sp.]|nr:hypothetical protein [Treponema sp.]